MQKSYDSCKEAVLHEVKTKIESLFAVQSKKSDEMEYASQGYGLLLHACGLRTKEVKSRYFAQVKQTVSFKPLVNIWKYGLHCEIDCAFIIPFSWTSSSPFRYLQMKKTCNG